MLRNRIKPLTTRQTMEYVRIKNKETIWRGGGEGGHKGDNNITLICTLPEWDSLLHTRLPINNTWEREREGEKQPKNRSSPCSLQHKQTPGKRGEGMDKGHNAALIYPCAHLCPLTKTTPQGGDNIMTQLQVWEKTVKGEIKKKWKKMPPAHNIITCGRPPFLSEQLQAS